MMMSVSFFYSISKTFALNFEERVPTVGRHSKCEGCVVKAKVADCYQEEKEWYIQQLVVSPIVGRRDVVW